MLDIGIFAPYGTDHDRNLAFCRDTDVHHIVLGTAQIAGENSDGVPSAETLKHLSHTYATGGVTLAALTPPRISQKAFSDPETRNREVDFMRHVLEGMGEAGIPFLHLYLSTDPAPSDPIEKARLWDGLVEVYRHLIPVAEKANVRVSTHHYHLPDRLLWNYETMSRLLNEAPSPFNGVTFCQGKSRLAGDDLVATIRSYGEKIFMFHIRDIITHLSDPVSREVEKRLADLGYLEVAFGSGEVDMIGSIRALKRMNYQGQIYPEHFPSIAGDSAAGLAWTIGYIRALDQAVGLSQV
ncbi:MAG: mannonate dehydratase [Candidatus Latescibacteria bacterium]|nr:mannonate dehydratase [Candidatus Latescibacterota bacterium]